MATEQFDKDLHLLVIGANGVGKSTLLHCFCNESVTNEGEGSGTNIFHFEELNIRIRVTEREKWNREHSSEFDAVAVVFSTTDTDSFDYCLDLVREIRNSRYFPAVAVENKIDLLEESTLDKELVEERLKKLHLRLYRISALEEFNVMHPFAYLLEKLTRNCDENSNEKKRSPVESIRLPSREGWGSPKQRRAKKEKCSIM